MMRSNATQAMLLGAVVGFAFAILPSCGKTTTGIRCMASNCDGCCDDNGTCARGASIESCGAKGQSCTACNTGQTCELIDLKSEIGGRCSGGASDGGTGGGTHNTGGSGGGSSGGGGGGTGSVGGGAGGGGVAPVCNSTNCSNGCCSKSGVCVTTMTPAKCGLPGAECAPCQTQNTCQGGVCTPCAGCIDLNTGNCEAGTSNTICGKTGTFCQACDQTTGQTCQAGVCAGGAVCNAGSCMGCCDGNDCILQAKYTDAQCGQGAFGTACTSCLAGQTCDVANTGACVGGSGTGGGSGAGGGVGTGDLFCDPTVPCSMGCCDFSAVLKVGFCVPDGAKCFLTTVGLTSCEAAGKKCGP